MKFKSLQTKIVLSIAGLSALALFQNCGSFTAITPTGFSASASSIAVVTPNPFTGKVSLAWTASSSPQTTGYIIQQSTDGVNFIEAARASSITTTISGLAPGNYTFRVLAYNAAGTSAPTATISATVPSKN